MAKTIGFFRLMRPANIITAVADILAGVAISGYFFYEQPSFSRIFWLVLSTVGLYGGGVVFNDVFDAELDRRERPERPIPSGVVTISEGTMLGAFLLAAGIYCAFMVSVVSGSLATATAAAALIYDKWSKHNLYLGPVNMGLCRGLNLLLGISVLPPQVDTYWFLGAIPVLYIAAVTMISRGEVYGSKRGVLAAAAILYLVVMVTVLIIAGIREHFLAAAIFVVVWAVMVFFPLFRAIRTPEGRFIGKAVKAGVIALILMNAAWASAFGVTYVALIIMMLLPISLLLARIFAVT